MMYCILLISMMYCVVYTEAADSSATWSYDEEMHDGPSHWSVDNPICGYRSQSPVNIQTNTAILNSSLTDFTFVNYDKAPATFTMSNNGHSVQVEVPDKTINMTGANLGSTFSLYQFHFHWGQNSSVGSEHNIDGKPVALEIHLVHWNSGKYDTYDMATNKSDGLAVLAVLVKVNESQTDQLNQYLGNFTDYIQYVPFHSSVASIPPFPVSRLIPADRSYWRYSGSLTTPPCYESVTWTVIKQPIYITAAQLNKFRQIKNKESEPFLYNYRPVQPLYGRTVYTSPSLLPSTACQNGDKIFICKYIPIGYCRYYHDECCFTCAGFKR